MSDFLSNLLYRSSGAAEVIQPRLPSLFEPATPYTGSLAATGSQLDEVAREVRWESVRDDTDAERSQSQMRPETEPPLDARPMLREERHFQREPVGESRPRSADAMPDRSQDEEMEPPRIPPQMTHAAPYMDKTFRTPPLIDARPVPRRPNLPSDNTAETRERESQPASPLAQPRAGTVQRPESSPAASAVHRPTPQHPAAPSNSGVTKPAALREPQPVATTRPRFAPSEPSRPSRPEASPRPAAVAPLPPPARRVDLAHPLPPARTSVPTEPTIQVTIGRIEVRAVSSPASAAKERTASPVMSLNEYLRQQAKRSSE